MISRPRRFLALLPFIFWLTQCDTWAEILPMMVGGFFVSIPYLLAWWLSDGFATVKFGTSCCHCNPYQVPIGQYNFMDPFNTWRRF